MTPCRMRTGLTLVELLLALIVAAVLAALAVPLYLRSIATVRSYEAVEQLQAIRQAEIIYHTGHGMFTEALDRLPVNPNIDLELTPRQFDYKIEQATDQKLLVVATSRTAPAAQQPLPPGKAPYRISIDEAGHIVRFWPDDLAGPAGGLGGGAGGSGPDTSGSGGSTGGGGGSGGVGGAGGGAGGGGGTGGGGSTGGDGGSTGGSATVVGNDTKPLTYIARGNDLWARWPDANTMNITGTLGLDALTQAFKIVQDSTLSAITNDLFRKGTSISFAGDQQLYAEACGGPESIACMQFLPNSADPPIPVPPSTPSFLPQIVFNPAFVAEDPTVLADVLAHEGTHFQQFLDGAILDLIAGTASVIDIEFRAWWNAAVFWEGVWALFVPFDTVVTHTAEAGYQAALQGEGALRDLIASLYLR